MPSAHPIPSIASLALSLYISDRKTERLPRKTVYRPCESVFIVYTVATFGYEEI